MRPVDVDALRRLRDRGPLTIPEAYDCGHETVRGEGHGMHRLTSAGYVVFLGWDGDKNDGLWTITRRGRTAVEEAEEKAGAS